jgi:preprotein translocase subunit SecA
MTKLADEYRLCAVSEPPELTSGLDAMVDGMIGSTKRSGGALRRLKAEAERVIRLEEKFRTLDDAALKSRIDELREQFRRQTKTRPAPVDEGLAAAREVAARRLGMRPRFVQLVGALALHHGYLAEMATGEGKSLTASVASVLAGWSGRPCHVVTVNDYLADRDAREFEPLYSACGLRVASVLATMQPPERRHGHNADITYTTSKELLADFLRDRIALGETPTPARRMVQSLRHPGGIVGTVMRGLHHAIVDEADSVLIDEAVTPLIIAGSDASGGPERAYRLAWQFVSRLEPQIDYRVNVRMRDIELLPSGLVKAEAFAEDLPPLWQSASRRKELFEQALQAREFFHRGKQYVVENSEVVIVDEFTGRLMPMRKWRHGLHQAIEAKEGVAMSALDETLARMSFQRFFRLYRRLSGMTGTGDESAAEFWHVYRLPVVRIPHHRPCQRQELPDRVFADPEQKWQAVADEVERLHATGRPVLVGTRSVQASEELSLRIGAKGLECAVLNATRHAEEAAIISRAGERGRITIATNMAGRGTDIKPGPGVVEAGGLCVVATERHESRRVDRQLFGRSGRQGDPGSAQAFVSVEDELLLRFCPAPVRVALREAIRRQLPGSARLAGAILARAQRSAQRLAFRQREQVVKLDSWLAEALSFTGSAQH